MTFPTEWKNKIHVPNHQPDLIHMNTGDLKKKMLKRRYHCVIKAPLRRWALVFGMVPSMIYLRLKTPADGSWIDSFGLKKRGNKSAGDFNIQSEP